MENKEILESFAKRLKELRKSNKMTQKDFAKKIGVTTTALSSYENGKQNPSITIAVKIAKEFNVSTDWLFDISKDITPIKPQTYSDIIAVLLKIENVADIVKNDDKYYLYFNDRQIVDFIEKWRKMKDLLELRLIDSEVYDFFKKTC